MPGGRPTAYDPAFCDRLVEVMGQGYSVAGAAGDLGVCRDTIYHWAKTHPEFSDAMKRAKAASAQWWESRLRDIATGKDGNAAAAIFGLKNRVSDEWRDKHEVDADVGLTFKTIIEKPPVGDR